MSTSMQSQRHSRGMPHPAFGSYDLAQPSHPTASYRNEDDLFDTLFPQPPPRSRTLAERLARPSLPLLRPSLQIDSADSSQSTTQPLSASNSIESVNSLSSYPSSTSSLSLLHSIQPYKQTSIDSSIDYYSPAVSDGNSADSVSSGRAQSQSSDTSAHDQVGPFTPLTPIGPPQTWRPKELSLVRKRQITAPIETSLPLHHATPTISGDRNALLIGLGLGGIDDLPNPAPSTSAVSPTPSTDKPAQPTQQKGLLHSRSPHLGSNATFAQDASAQQGPKQLLLVSSGGPPTVRRFAGPRPSEHLLEAYMSPIAPPVSEPSSSRCNTPQMRSAIPILPSGPAFVATRPITPDPSSTATTDRQGGLSAEEFLAQIASTPEYQASKYFEAAAFGPASAWAPSAQPEQDSAVQDVDHSDDQYAIDPDTNSTPVVSATPGSSLATAKAPGFSWTQRSRAASLSKRKAPPTPLVLTSSPATSNSDTLPGSARDCQRRSLTATTPQRSPLSAPHSSNSDAGADSAAKTPTSSGSGSGSYDHQPDSASIYDEPLRTAFYDFDTEEDTEEHQLASRPASKSYDDLPAAVAPSAGATSSHRRASSSAVSSKSGRSAILDRDITESPFSRHSALSSRVTSLRSEAIHRQSSTSGSAAAFEFDDLDSETASEGLSLQTMMGFLQRQDSQKVVNHSFAQDDSATSRSQQPAAPVPADSTIVQAASSNEHKLNGSDAASHRTSPSAPATPRLLAEGRESSAPASAAPVVPSFNVSIFGPGHASETKLSGSPDPSSLDRGDTAQEHGTASSPLSPGAPTTRPRKQSIVPAPPSFAIRQASQSGPQILDLGKLLPAISDSVDVRPVAMERANSNELGNSRWSSGSESDGESAMSIKAGRKSFSKSRKSFSTSHKNSLASTTNAPASASDGMADAGRTMQRRSSKARLSNQTVSAAAQTLPASPKAAAASMSKRLRLNGLSSLKKKSFSNLSSQLLSPSTPSFSRAPKSAGPSFLGQTEFPFPSSAPPSAPPQTISTPAIPARIGPPFERDGYSEFPIRTAFASTFAASNKPQLDSPRTPVSAPGASSSNGAPEPLTTQQILAQARSNVWPENYIGNGVSSAGLSSPFLAVAHDTFNHNFAPSRLAPAPPKSASTSRAGWMSTPVTPPMPQTSGFSVPSSQDKSLPSTPTAEAPPMGRSRSRTAEIAPPKNLRHLRQSSSNTNLNKMRKEAPADVFKPSQAKAAPSIDEDLVVPCTRPDVSAGDDEKLRTISETGSLAPPSIKQVEGTIDVDGPLPSLPILVNRSRAKLKKAQRIRKQNDRFPRYTSWSEYGMQWVVEQGADAFHTLAAEGLPSSAILAASGAPSGRSHRMMNVGSGGGGGGGGDGNSDESDTDDYGSSDGGGGNGGGFGGAGGAGGDKRPGAGRDGADGSESDDENGEEDTDEDQYAVTDEDSEDDYGRVEPAPAARSGRGGAGPSVPARNASMPGSTAQAEHAGDSDSSDDRPLGQLVDDPRALQKALRAKERKRHFDMAAQALEGRGSSSGTPSNSSHARQNAQPQGRGQANDAAVNPNELAQRLNKVQGRRERAHAQEFAMMQRSQTVARQDAPRSAAAVSRSKSVRTAPAERYVHPAMRARTPSEAALRAKATAQAMPHGPSPISSALAGSGKMPELPSNAMEIVAAAQQAMAHAQANPSPAALAQAQALATSATAALNAATAQVKRQGSSPLSPSFNFGDPVGQVPISPRMADGFDMAGVRRRADSRAHAVPLVSSSGTMGAAPAVASSHQPGMLQRLRSRSVSRNQAPLTINTATAPPLPDLGRPSTASKDSQASSSPHSIHTATFAALSQAAVHRRRPSVDSSSTHGDAHMQRGASAISGVAPSSHESGSGVASADRRQPHKVFILSRQRFTTVEVAVSARARDLALEVIERERLPMDDSKGGWVVFDCSAQLGIERPLREYEMITDVMNVRAHPKTDYFLIKRTELSSYLSIRSVPASSPALAGWVYVQDRKKKWNKRWLELRDHALYHAKNEKGKDETSICQISTFDVYLVDSSAIKMPKANGFALRSQDPITMFEKPEQDYMHYFCLTDPAAHRDWVRAIMNARTYILRQEKAVLFQIESPPSSQETGAAGAVASGGLSRKNTSRRPNGRTTAAAADTSNSSSAAGPSQPAPLIDSSVFAGPFAKGSLLADKAINDAKEALRGHAATVSPPTAALHDLSLSDRNAVRTTDARRREEAIERQRRMKADGQPLIDFARK